MKKFIDIIMEIDKLGKDVSFDVDVENKIINITFNDYEGFNSDYNEVFRNYDNPKAVEDFLNMLEIECISKEDDYYIKYLFDGFCVSIGYASWDIFPKK